MDEAVEAGWALYELPARHILRTDGEAVAACATIARWLLERGPLAAASRALGGHMRRMVHGRIR